MRRIARIALLTGLVAVAFGVSDAKASPRFFFQIGTPVPPPPVVAVAPVRPIVPGYGMVWRPGYYTWTGYRYAWVPGVWVRPPFARAVWVGPRWVRQPRGFAWVGGYWRR
jgi:hypothetical protein